MLMQYAQIAVIRKSNNHIIVSYILSSANKQLPKGARNHFFPQYHFAFSMVVDLSPRWSIEKKALQNMSGELDLTCQGKMRTAFFNTGKYFSVLVFGFFPPFRLANSFIHT